MSSVKVLHYIWSANFGGIEKLVIDLTKAQKIQKVVDSSILIGCHKGNFIDKLQEENIPHQFAYMKHGYDFRPSVIRNIKTAISDVDIVHIHTFNPLIFILSVFLKKKIVYTVHGNFNFGRKKTLADRFNNIQKKVCLNYFTDFISFNSNFTKRIATKRYGLKSTNHKVIYNCIFVDKTLKDKLPDDNILAVNLKNKFIVGTSSRFAGFKRIDRLIAAYADFAKNKTDVQLLLVGDGPLRKELEIQVEKLHISNSTTFTGYQSKVHQYQQLMTVCVFPSENEPFGLVAVETLFLGKPTLVFKDAGGMTEILETNFKEDILDDLQQMTNRLEFYYDKYRKGNINDQLQRTDASFRFDIFVMEKAFFEVYSSF